MKLLHAILIIIFATSCSAQPIEISSESTDCANISISAEVDYCVSKELAASKPLLANTLISFEKKVKEAYKAAPEIGKELIHQIKESQEAWLIFRDKNCKLDAFIVEEGTPAYITTINSCIARMNTQRIEALKNLQNEIIGI